jgi:hypothetical protein
MPLRDLQQLTNGVGIRLIKAWSSDFSATLIPLMRCRLYGEVCHVLWRQLSSCGGLLRVGFHPPMIAHGSNFMLTAVEPAEIVAGDFLHGRVYKRGGL